MRMLRTPLLVLGLLYVCFFGYLATSSSQLPGRVATHFDGSGRPNGWMSRDSHLRFMVVFGLAFPLFVPALVFVSRFLPDQCYNLPHRDYWLAPTRRAETMAYLLGHSLWFSLMALGFAIGIHASIIYANSLARAHLSTLLVLALAGCFLAGTAIWGVSLMRHFNRAPE
jgi:ABC-type Fe3+ transport system permease subunit